MRVTIHRGSNEIGGTSIQVSTANTTVLLDAGLPLSESSKYIDLSAINADALLISHPHQDHYGLMEEIPASIPVYVGEIARGLIEAPRPFLDKPLPHNSFQYIYPKVLIEIGDFAITPYLVDHSTPEAYAFLIESRQGDRIFYSGDFRTHGRKAFLVEDLISNPPSDIDILFLEGTMMRRGLGEFNDEKAVENAIYKVLKSQQNISFLITSSQNIDRIISASNACKRTGKFIVIDFYTAWILELMKKVSTKVTTMDWENVFVYAHYRHDKALKNYPDIFGNFRKRVYRQRITKEVLRQAPDKYLWIGKMSQFAIMDLYKEYGPINVIYSQWLGYLDGIEGQCYGAKEVSSYRDDPNVNYTYAHTSGHAPINDLQRFANAMNPRYLIPVHTKYPQDYVDIFHNVRLLNNGCSFDLDGSETCKRRTSMTDDALKYFKTAKELNEQYESELTLKQWHFRGNRKSFSLISLSQLTPEMGLSGLKTKKQGENAIKWRLEKTIGLKPGRATPEKVLQAWVINQALNNGHILPFGQELTFLTSELAFTDVHIDSKRKIGKLVNDILAIDAKGTLWVIELKSARQQSRLKDQVRDFIHLIHSKQEFFNNLVNLLTNSGHKVYKQVRGMVVWPDIGFPKDWGEIEEIRYTTNFAFKDRHQ